MDFRSQTPCLVSETVELKLLSGELLIRPKGWPPAPDREIAAWIVDTLGPLVVVGDGTDAALRMSAGDYVAFFCAGGSWAYC